jgi:quercetin dioxygenase-like cupin family protein
MRIVRVYTGDDGESHFEDLEVPLKEGPYGSLSRLTPVTGVQFRETPVGASLDFHNAPQRQFVITLSGSVEIECGDGSKRTLGAGDILLADDTTGRGHITREVEGPRRSIFLPLPPDFDPAPWRV